MKLLITGGAGFIGSNFIHYTLSHHKNDKVVNLDKLTYCGNLENLRDIEKDPRHKFIKGDICNEKLVEKIFQKEKPDFLLNFAAETHVDRSIKNPKAFIKTDIFGTHTLLQTAKTYGIKRFLQVSTDEVYGSIKKGKFKETDPLMPNSPYSASKAGADLLVRAYFKTFNLPVLITRSSNNFGPCQYPEKLIPLFITNLLRGKKVPLYGTGLNIRDWIYVLDNCAGIDIVLRKGEVGEIYNIGGGNEKTNLEIARIILKELGKDESWIEYVKDRPGHDFRYALDTGKIRKLGWKPKYTFEKGIKETINWYKTHQEWWKKLI
ncbi:MAG TPA: dTDP-glucose 4,6-dehydratase [Candidatus Pacearchaeota archaeon]|nr:dTDP-glucose 4,6-dehydratase [Candidatus Pacearchaeota archaeon]HOK94424.1 dTDP-glucose 4,6-dehydratase [Candidatus Pacearchaeota archaeon]HPO75492.1 dTDP-glucose 4,6-dehydratase [Candidatus Pacearchaeota archaeon]